jgi:hypothetical protein
MGGGFGRVGAGRVRRARHELAAANRLDAGLAG